MNWHGENFTAILGEGDKVGIEAVVHVLSSPSQLPQHQPPGVEVRDNRNPKEKEGMATSHWDILTWCPSTDAWQEREDQ
jgi:hypothetical protein